MALAGRQVGEAVLALAVLVGVWGCRPKAPAGPPKEAGFIAVVGTGKTDALWPVLQASAARFQSLTPTALIRAEAPEVVSPNLQARLISQLRKDGMRGLCIQVQDPAALAAELESLRGEGAVVVTIMKPVPAEPPFLHSGVDPVAAGAALADAVARLVPQRGTLGVLYDGDDELCRLHRQGFGRQMTHYPSLTVLRELDCEGDAARAVDLMRRGMERFPGIDGWVALGSWPLRHPYDGRPLLPPECALVVPGPLDDYVHEFVTDRCQAMVVADYEAVVTRALEMCSMVLRREIVQVRVYEAPSRWVTRDTLDEFQRDWATWTGATEEPSASGPR